MRIREDAPLRTLVIERQVLIAKALRSFINRNALVDVVADASHLTAEDLDRIRPELIVFGSDGASLDVAEALGIARRVLPRVRFCVLSSFANPDVMQRSIACGADGFIVKDVTPGELDTALHVIASGSSYVDPRVAGGMLRRRRSVGGDVSSPVNELTAREGDILRLIAGGCSNKEISIRLRLSEKTIKNYVSRIFGKLNVTARTQAAVYAIKAGFA